MDVLKNHEGPNKNKNIVKKDTYHIDCQLILSNINYYLTIEFVRDKSFIIVLLTKVTFWYCSSFFNLLSYIQLHEYLYILCLKISVIKFK